MENFTSKEIDTLVDALEVWEKKDGEERLMFGLMNAMLMPKDASPEMKEKIESEEAKRNAKLDMEARQRKEVSLLLKVKLINMKQDRLVDSVR